MKHARFSNCDVIMRLDNFWLPALGWFFSSFWHYRYISVHGIFMLHGRWSSSFVSLRKKKTRYFTWSLSSCEQDERETKIERFGEKKLIARHRPSLLRWLRAGGVSFRWVIISLTELCIFFVFCVLILLTPARLTAAIQLKLLEFIFSLRQVVMRNSKPATAAKACVQKIHRAVVPLFPNH